MPENKLVNASIIFMGIIVLMLVLKTFKVFLRPLALAIILTLLLIPIIKFLKGLKIPFAITITGVVVILLLIVYLIGFLISIEASKINERLPNYQNQIEQATEYFTSKPNIDIKKFINIGNMISFIKAGVQAVGVFISEIFLAIVFILFLIPSYTKITENLEKNLDGTKKRKFRSTLLQTEKSIRNYLSTKIIISLGTAVVSAIALLIFRADFIFIIALLIFLLNFIPNIGSFIAVILALISYALKFGPTTNIIWLAILLILIQVIFGNLIEPKFAGKRLKLSPIVIIISLFIWYWIWGIGGMILAVPITSIIKIVLEHTDSAKNFRIS